MESTEKRQKWCFSAFLRDTAGRRQGTNEKCRHQQKETCASRTDDRKNEKVPKQSRCPEWIEIDPRAVRLRPTQRRIMALLVKSKQGNNFQHQRGVGVIEFPNRSQRSGGDGPIPLTSSGRCVRMGAATKDIPERRFSYRGYTTFNPSRGK